MYPATFVLLTFIPYILALSQVTIDDADPAIVYDPAKWNAEPGCKDCSVKPNPSLAQGGTWHDSRHIPNTSVASASVQFTGTAVSVYGILPLGPGSGYTTDITFYVDGKQLGHFNQSVTTGHGFLYSSLLFSTQGLSNSPHTLIISNGVQGGLQPSLLLLDYIRYSSEDTTSNTSQSSASTASPPSVSEPSKNGETLSSSSGSQTTTLTIINSLTPSIPTTAGMDSGTSNSKNDPSSPTTSNSDFSVTPTSHSITSPSQEQHPSSKKIPVILASLIGGLILLLLPVGLCFYYRRKRKQKLLALHQKLFPYPPQIQVPVLPPLHTRREKMSRVEECDVQTPTTIFPNESVESEEIVSIVSQARQAMERLTTLLRLHGQDPPPYMNEQ